MSESAIHLKITSRRDRRYWLKVALPPTAELRELDEFLRDTWLECCRHMSAFSTRERLSSEIDPGVTVGAIFDLVTSLDYVYDFGSSTELVIKRLKGTPMNARGITLLARNEPPPAPCDACGAPAIYLCSECSFDGGGFCCDDHSYEHECGEESLLSIVNSPRMGVCGYGG